MESFAAAPHHDVLTLIIQIAVLLCSARALGEVAQRLGQPSVVGEILAGIVLGPSLLSGLFPALGQWIVPQNEISGYLLETVSLIGAMFLLLITGLETDLALIRRHARTAIGVSAGGILVTFTSGYILGQNLPDFLLADASQRLVFALFVATAMSISAIPVIAKVLMDMKLMRRDIGQTIIASGMSDDTTGWILLSIVAGLASGASVTASTVLQAVGSVLAFMVFSFTIGRFLVKRVIDFVQDEVISAERLTTTVVVLAFAWGAITQALNLEAVLGAFVMGILLGRLPRLPESVHQRLTSMALGVFTPIFFAVAGLKVNVRHLLEPHLIALTLVVIFVASAGKFAGTYAGARLIGGRDHWTALCFGAGLNARGAMEIIVATIGLQLGILGQDMFSIIVLMAMVTSLMAPPALRWTLQHVVPEQQELDRLRQEELTAGSLIGKVHRILVPVRRRRAGNEIQGIQAFLVQKLSRRGPLSVTLFNVSETGGKSDGAAFLEQLAKHFQVQGVELSLKVVEGSDPTAAILDEAQKDYDLMILGATERTNNSTTLFHPMIDEMVRLVGCPTLVVSGRAAEDRWPPKRILVPTNGSLASRRAAEIGFALVGGSQEEIVLLNVVQSEPRAYPRGGARTTSRSLETGRQIVADLQQLGEVQGARTRGLVEVGDAADIAIIDLAKREGIDLIIIGTDVRPASHRLFLGPRVERILAAAPCPVVVINEF